MDTEILDYLHGLLLDGDGRDDTMPLRALADIGDARSTASIIEFADRIKAHPNHDSGMYREWFNEALKALAAIQSNSPLLVLVDEAGQPLKENSNG